VCRDPLLSVQQSISTGCKASQSRSDVLHKQHLMNAATTLTVSHLLRHDLHDRLDVPTNAAVQSYSHPRYRGPETWDDASWLSYIPTVRTLSQSVQLIHFLTKYRPTSRKIFDRLYCRWKVSSLTGPRAHRIPAGRFLSRSLSLSHLIQCLFESLWKTSDFQAKGQRRIVGDAPSMV
jgi:hypothetical protein